jgi:outer membrane protein OmpA-like peptidoglycan-associated protein
MNTPIEFRSLTAAERDRRSNTLAFDARDVPIVLVAGPYADALFVRGAAGTVLRRENDVVWIRVDTPSALSSAMDLVGASHGRYPDAVLIPVIPDGDVDGTVLRHAFSEWRIELQKSSRHPACALPCYLAVYACLGADDGESACHTHWFGDAIEFHPSPDGVEHARDFVSAVRGQLDVAAHAPMQQRGTLGHAILDWLDDVALLSSLSALANTSPFSLHGLMLADLDRMPPRAGAWMRWLVGRTGIRPPVTAPWSGPLPLPPVAVGKYRRDGVVRRVGRVSGYAMPIGAQTSFRASASRRLRYALLSIGAVALIAAPAWSAWSNGELTARIERDLQIFWDTSDSEIGAKRAAFDAIARDRDALARHAREGIPLSLRGFYRGDELRPAVDRAIASYRPARSMLPVDALALFDAGKSTLSAGSADRVLRPLLPTIVANPDKHVLIAGHADSGGSTSANVALSEARARAIRDWFVEVGGMPVERFVIGAYGDRHPVADNDSAVGRALNRRVEILLIPTSL